MPTFSGPISSATALNTCQHVQYLTGQQAHQAFVTLLATAAPCSLLCTAMSCHVQAQKWHCLR